MTKFSFARHLCLSCTLLAAFVSSAKATPESDFEARRELERKNFETMASAMPALEVHRAGDVFRIEVENKLLVVHTSLPTTSGAPCSRVSLANGTLALVNVQNGSSPSDHLSAVPSAFQFTFSDFSHPLEMSSLGINAQANFCGITRVSQFPGGGFRSVALVQQNNRSVGMGASVHLTVNEWDQKNNSPVTIELQAADFPTLLRQHAAECDRYVRPLMRDLGQESIFAPELLVGWQVFADSLTPEPAVAEQVRKLLPRLDVDDYHERAKAVEALERLGRPGATVLMHLDRRPLTPEQNAHIDAALIPYSQLTSKEVAKLRSSPSFLLDCLYSDDAWLRKIALARLREIVGKPIDFDPTASDAGRYQKIEELRSQLRAAR